MTYPIVTISVGVVSTATRSFSHFGEVVAVATEMKKAAKALDGSAFAVDRRAGR